MRIRLQDCAAMRHLVRLPICRTVQQHKERPQIHDHQLLVDIGCGRLEQATPERNMQLLSLARKKQLPYTLRVVVDEDDVVAFQHQRPRKLHARESSANDKYFHMLEYYTITTTCLSRKEGCHKQGDVVIE